MLVINGYKVIKDSSESQASLITGPSIQQGDPSNGLPFWTLNKGCKTSTEDLVDDCITLYIGPLTFRGDLITLLMVCLRNLGPSLMACYHLYLLMEGSQPFLQEVTPQLIPFNTIFLPNVFI